MTQSSRSFYKLVNLLKSRSIDEINITNKEINTRCPTTAEILLHFAATLGSLQLAEIRVSKGLSLYDHNMLLQSGQYCFV